MTSSSRSCGYLCSLLALFLSSPVRPQNASPHLYDTSNAESRSITAENPTGARGAGGAATEGWGKNAAKSLERGWKVSPARQIRAGQAIEIANIGGNGIIKHIWLTPAGATWRSLILRVYWDEEKQPSVEVPLGDFFAMGLGEFAQVNSAAVGVNPGAGFNAYWEMPFRKHARITVENRSKSDAGLYYQVDYSVEPIASRAAYFHAQFHNELRTEGTKPYVILQGIRGSGQYVGTYMTYGIRHSGWWGEGEIKFYIDDDRDFATIVGTGTEDYFGGAWDFMNPQTHQYQPFSNLYSGMPQVIRPEDSNDPVRFSLYRWHMPDPIRFKQDLTVTMQMLGWTPPGSPRSGEYDQLHEHVSSVAFWYQTEPHQAFPQLPPDEELNVK